MRTISGICLLIALFMSSCSKPDREPNISRAELGVSFRNVSSEGIITPKSSDDPAITKLRILVFAGNAIDVNKVFANSNQFRVSARVGSNRKVFIIANESSSLTEKLDRVIFVSDLQKIMQPISSDGQISKMFVAEKDGVEVLDDGSSSISMELRRAYAKITLHAQKSNKIGQDEIQVTGVSLSRNNTESTLLESTHKGTLNDLSYTIDNPITLQAGNELSIIPEERPLYVYENIFSQVQDSTGRAPYITLHATYNGIKMKYHANINDVHSTGDGAGSFRIERNHHYKLSATIESMGNYKGMILKTNVLPWTVEDVVVEIPIPHIKSIKGGKDHQSLKPMKSSTEYVVQVGRPFYIEVAIEGASDMDWRPTITDRGNFDIVYLDEHFQRQDNKTAFKADGKDVGRFKIRALSPHADRDRKFKLYFTVEDQIVVEDQESSVTDFAYFGFRQPK